MSKAQATNTVRKRQFLLITLHCSWTSYAYIISVGKQVIRSDHVQNRHWHKLATDLTAEIWFDAQSQTESFLFTERLSIALLRLRVFQWISLRIQYSRIEYKTVRNIYSLKIFHENTNHFTWDKFFLVSTTMDVCSRNNSVISQLFEFINDVILSQISINIFYSIII